MAESVRETLERALIQGEDDFRIGSANGYHTLGCAITLALTQLEALERDREARIAELESTFEHNHKAGDPYMDECAKCGLDLRDQIHTRIPR